MKGSHRVVIILLLVALVFSVASFVIANYFPQLRSGSPGTFDKDGGGNLKIVVEAPEVYEENGGIN